jgi:hypothetical protein
VNLGYLTDYSGYGRRLTGMKWTGFDDERCMVRAAMCLGMGMYFILVLVELAA